MKKPINKFERIAQEFLDSEEGKKWAEEWLDPVTGFIREDKMEEARRPAARLKFSPTGQLYLEDIPAEEREQIRINIHEQRKKKR